MLIWLVCDRHSHQVLLRKKCDTNIVLILYGVFPLPNGVIPLPSFLLNDTIQTYKSALQIEIQNSLNRFGLIID